jgi:hypothetical protein
MVSLRYIFGRAVLKCTSSTGWPYMITNMIRLD